MILGVGTGWIREELEAVGVAWTERGRFLDEGIKVLRHLWSQEAPSPVHRLSRDAVRTEARPAGWAADLGWRDHRSFSQAGCPNGRRVAALGCFGCAFRSS